MTTPTQETPEQQFMRMWETQNPPPEVWVGDGDYIIMKQGTRVLLKARDPQGTIP